MYHDLPGVVTFWILSKTHVLCVAHEFRLCKIGFMPKTSPCFTALFALWPRTAELAADMGVPPNRARQWIKRDSLEPFYWPLFVRLLKVKFGRRVSYEQLIEATRKHGEARIEASRRSARNRQKKRDLVSQQGAEAA